MEVERRPCKKCGCPLALVPGPNGKTIPLDMRSQVYIITKDLTGEPVAQPTEAFVSHFRTCPKANDFSGSKR